MKKIFTLLFCVAAVALCSSAATNPVDQCINVLLGNETPTTLMAVNLDADNDGAITIHDLTVIIDNQLNAQVNRAPEQTKDIEKLVDGIINDVEPVPTINDVNEAIEQQIKKK